MQDENWSRIGERVGSMTDVHPVLDALVEVTPTVRKELRTAFRGGGTETDQIEQLYYSNLIILLGYLEEACNLNPIWPQNASTGESRIRSWVISLCWRYG